MSNEIELLEKIKRKTNVSFHPADAEALKQFRLLGAPEDAVSFFEQHDPTECAEINKVRLLPIEEILFENRECVPGADIQPLGYVVFATTVYGDAFCFATKAVTQSPPVVLVAHDWELDESTLSAKLAELAKPVANSFYDFLRAWVEERLDIEPLYPEWEGDFPTPIH